MTLAELQSYLTERYTQDNIPAEMHDLIEYAGRHESTPPDTTEIDNLKAELDRVKKANLTALFNTAGQVQATAEEVVEEEVEEEIKLKTMEEIIKEGVDM